jgi:regulator of replication initiation timing
MQEKKMKTEQDVVVLTEENNKLKRENEQLKREGAKQPEMVQTQKEEMKVVKNDLRHLKDQLQIENAVVEVLSSQVVRVSSYFLLRSILPATASYMKRKYLGHII